MSKWIKNPASNIIPLWVLPTLADLFQISVEDFVYRNYKEENGSNEESTDRITREMSDSVFKGYDGKYYCYFYPTISEEKNFLNGILEISKYINQVKLKIVYSNAKENDEIEEIEKEYVGTIEISKSLGACYCILKSNKLGEMSFLTFRHKYLNNKQNDCRMAEVLTVSAGESHYPTVQRMFISREEIQQKDLYLILPMLKLNCEEIIISKTNLEQLVKDFQLSQNFTDSIEEISTKEEYYILQEKKLKDRLEEFILHNDNSHNIFEYLIAVRERSIGYRYNKASRTVDNSLRDILLNKGYYK